MSASARDFAVRLLAAFATTLLLAPVLGALLPREPFHRVTTRTFSVLLVAALLVRRGPVSTWPERVRAMGFRGPLRLRRIAAGAALGALLLAVLLLASWALGGRALRDTAHRLPVATHLLEALLAAVGVSLLEEILCRGYLKDALGGTWSAILYAGAHYLRPPEGSAPAAGYDPLLAVKQLPEILAGWTEPRPVLLGCSGLFLFGLALNRLRERTGTLYAGMGLHGVLVFGLVAYRRVFHVEPSGNPWIFGGNRLHDGLLGLLGMALVLVAAYRLPLPAKLPEPEGRPQNRRTAE